MFFIVTSVFAASWHFCTAGCVLGGNFWYSVHSGTKVASMIGFWDIANSADFKLYRHPLPAVKICPYAAQLLPAPTFYGPLDEAERKGFLTAALQFEWQPKMSGHFRNYLMCPPCLWSWMTSVLTQLTQLSLPLNSMPTLTLWLFCTEVHFTENLNFIRTDKTYMHLAIWALWQLWLNNLW